MKCFCLFKEKSKSQKKNTRPPNLRNQNGKSDSSANSVLSTRSIEEMYREKEHNLRVFTFSELREATHGFSRSVKIGEGGFGSVYKGTIMVPDENGEPVLVAIKKLNKNGFQGHKQWLAEVQFLGIVDHPNLVKLLGYCCDDGDRGIQRLLVYQYMSNKSLEDHLFSRATETLPWKTRLEIMLGAAQGLAYLHEGLEVQVIFRDFKPSNVLLDEDFKPKLSDFGLAREGPNGDHTHVSTAIVGTYGYAAPEYITTGHLTYKSDIYTFGVVLYEVLTGRRAVDRKLPTMEQKLLEWVKQFPVDSKRFSTIIDPEMRNQCSLSSAKKIAKLADSCLIKNQNARPSMSRIVEALKEIIEELEAVD